MYDMYKHRAEIVVMQYSSLFYFYNDNLFFYFSNLHFFFPFFLGVKFDDELGEDGPQYYDTVEHVRTVAVKVAQFTSTSTAQIEVDFVSQLSLSVNKLRDATEMNSNLNSNVNSNLNSTLTSVENSRKNSHIYEKSNSIRMDNKTENKNENKFENKSENKIDNGNIYESNFENENENENENDPHNPEVSGPVNNSLFVQASTATLLQRRNTATSILKMFSNTKEKPPRKVLSDNVPGEKNVPRTEISPIHLPPVAITAEFSREVRSFFTCEIDSCVEGPLLI